MCKELPQFYALGFALEKTWKDHQTIGIDYVHTYTLTLQLV
ncbi:hypothetical protein THZG08_330009 [Vibrio owensii]|nr:hypothetical protein THZG08_330009 [Vibrio owensii]CAH1571532.1 hypothetical protein THOA03_330009 [Vibrio owensii]